MAKWYRAVVGLPFLIRLCVRSRKVMIFERWWASLLFKRLRTESGGGSGAFFERLPHRHIGIPTVCNPPLGYYPRRIANWNVDGSSITFEDPPARSQSTVIDTSEGKANKRLRSTNTQVKSTQQAAHQVGGCGLGGCAHPLTEEPRENKQHIKDKHDSHIPRKPNQVRPLVGILHRRREPALSRKDVLKCAAEGALMCTWGARGTPCGMIFEGDVAQASLARHVETKHWKRKFGCDTCEFTTCFLYSLKRHKNKWHNCRTDGVSGNNPENKEDLDEEEPPKKRRRTK